MKGEGEVRADRVLVLAAGRDGQLTCEILSRMGVECQRLESRDELWTELSRSVGALIIAEELLTDELMRGLIAKLSEQPPWSDLPVLVVASAEHPVGELMRHLQVLGNVSVLQRPVGIDSLVTAVQVALRARRRQYQVRDLLRDREEADRRKNEFLAMLAHELRNPLAPIRMAAAAIAAEMRDEYLREASNIIERQVAHMAKLIDDLLEVSRVTRGKISLQKEVIRLSDVVKCSVEIIEPYLRERQHQLEVSLPVEPIEIEADRVRMAQVLANLLHNAAKFTPPGGQIAILATDHEDHVVLRVRDNGMGIEPHLLPRVFDLFVQSERALDRALGGLGIGLTIVKSVIELHGGSVHAESQGLGQGTEFVLRLPKGIARQRPSNLPIAHSGKAGDGQALKILIVEDHVDGAWILERLLRVWGHEVGVAHDGAAALQMAAQLQPNVVLLDIGLPELDGYEVAKRLRVMPGLERTRLIAVTGYGTPEDRARARLAGIDIHLAKPVDLEMLQQALRGQVADRTSHPSLSSSTLG